MLSRIQKHLVRRIWFFRVDTKMVNNILLIISVASDKMFEIVGITRCMCRGLAQTLNRPNYFDLRQPINKEGVCIICGYAQCFYFSQREQIHPAKQSHPVLPYLVPLTYLSKGFWKLAVNSRLPKMVRFGK